ncbi:hypothetical protein LXH09_36025 [Streptomyces sp. CS7]|uniref:hypothetical protein n=1 Tax=Streptomyces sp. CS-7 TaxID=2906769 RepID=UPI0021B42DBC|nr:hypothetical protein [Streptomyces sp. CS-7]MCT6782038.1 hypothetical protein [Streptomyces sp. CS-7]
MLAKIWVPRNAAVLVSPIAIGLPIFYYFFGDGRPPENNFSYAPLVVSHPLVFTYSFAYAAAASVSAWESGRLREYKVWNLGAARSKFAVAVRALLAPIALSWIVLTFPVALALFQTGTLPTFMSLGPLCMGLVLCVAHAIIGFAIGSRLPPLVSAPILAAATWVLVASSMASSEFWIRHVSGQFSFSLMLGEAIPLRVLIPPILFTGSLALGIVLLWIVYFHWIIRAIAAALVTAYGVTAAVHMVSEWGHTPPLLTAQAPLQCFGNAPRVCLPEVMRGRGSDVDADVRSTLKSLQDTGLKVQPHKITDNAVYGRHPRSSTNTTWYVNFTGALLAEESVRYRIGFAAAKFGCREPSIETSRSVRLWIATVIGEAEEERKRVAMEVTPFDGQKRVEETVKSVLKMPKLKQAEWFNSSLEKACVGR